VQPNTHYRSHHNFQLQTFPLITLEVQRAASTPPPVYPSISHRQPHLLKDQENYSVGKHKNTRDAPSASKSITYGGILSIPPIPSPKSQSRKSA
jgi:hypothetical protein